MSTSSCVCCKCQRCGATLEVVEGRLGRTMNCYHCGLETLLETEPAKPVTLGCHCPRCQTIIQIPQSLPTTGLRCRSCGFEMVFRQGATRAEHPGTRGVRRVWFQAVPAVPAMNLTTIFLAAMLIILAFHLLFTGFAIFPRSSEAETNALQH